MAGRERGCPESLSQSPGMELQHPPVPPKPLDEHLDTDQGFPHQNPLTFDLFQNTTFCCQHSNSPFFPIKPTGHRALGPSPASLPAVPPLQQTALAELLGHNPHIEF